MNQNEQPRKAGSSSRDPPNESQSHGDRPSEQTQTHGRGTEQQHQLYRGHTEGYHFRQRGAGETAYHDEQVSRDARQSGRQRQDGSRRPGSTRQMQQPTRQARPARSQQPRQRAPETPSSMTNGQKSAAATSNEDWHMLDPNLSSSISPPSYSFPGTWPAALNDTSHALTSVSTATASYASALTHSGIAKAGRSIGTAFATSANKHALSVADWATDRTGTASDQLPRPLSTWLRNAQDKKKKTEKMVKKEDDGVFGDDKGKFVLAMGETNREGDVVMSLEDLGYSGSAPPMGGDDDEEEEDGWAFAPTTSGAVPGTQKVEERDDDSAGARDVRKSVVTTGGIAPTTQAVVEKKGNDGKAAKDEWESAPTTGGIAPATQTVEKRGDDSEDEGDGDGLLRVIECDD